MDNFQRSPRVLFAGRMTRDYFISAEKKVYLDILGGNLIYAAVGYKIWDKDERPGLIARIGEDYPQHWLDECREQGFDTIGINVLPGKIDLRAFYAYQDRFTRVTGDPVPYFTAIDHPFPKELLDYQEKGDEIDSRTRLLPTSLRQSDIPELYMDANVAHLCPLDYLTHSLLPAVFRQAGFTTVTLDPSPGYMNPTHFTQLPAILTGLTAFMPSEDDLLSLYRGRSEDLWGMAEELASYGVDYIIIKRGEAGQYLYDRSAQRRWEIPSYPIKVRNPTGVGDSFCGGFLAGYLKTYDPVEATLYGNIAAALTAEGTGAFYALEALPGLPEARIEMLRQQVLEV